MGLASGRADTLQLVAPLTKDGKFLTLAQAMDKERKIDKDDKEAIVRAWSPLVFLPSRGTTPQATRPTSTSSSLCT